MKKIFFFAVLAAAFTFAACGNEETTEEQPQEDSVVVEEVPAPVDTVVAEEPVVEEPQAKPAAKKQAAAKTEESKKVDPSQLKTNVAPEIAGKKVRDESNTNASKAKSFEKKQTVTDNGNTLKSADASKAQESGQASVGEKKQGITRK